MYTARPGADAVEQAGLEACLGLASGSSLRPIPHQGHQRWLLNRFQPFLSPTIQSPESGLGPRAPRGDTGLPR